MSSHAKRRSSRRRRDDVEQDDHYRSCRERRGTPYRWRSSLDDASSRSSSRGSPEQTPDRTRWAEEERPTLLTSSRRHSSKDHRRSHRRCSETWSPSDCGSFPSERRSSGHRRNSLPSPEIHSNSDRCSSRRSSKLSHSSRKHRRRSSCDLETSSATDASRRHHQNHAASSESDGFQTSHYRSVSHRATVGEPHERWSGRYRGGRRSKTWHGKDLDKSSPFSSELEPSNSKHDSLADYQKCNFPSDSNNYQRNQESSSQDKSGNYLHDEEMPQGYSNDARSNDQCRDYSSSRDSQMRCDDISRNHLHSVPLVADASRTHRLHIRQNASQFSDFESQSDNGSSQSHFTPAAVHKVAEDRLSTQLHDEMENEQYKEHEGCGSEIRRGLDMSDSQDEASRDRASTLDESGCEHVLEASARKDASGYQHDLVIEYQASSTRDAEEAMSQHSCLSSFEKSSRGHNSRRDFAISDDSGLVKVVSGSQISQSDGHSEIWQDDERSDSIRQDWQHVERRSDPGAEERWLEARRFLESLPSHEDVRVPCGLEDTQAFQEEDRSTTCPNFEAKSYSEMESNGMTLRSTDMVQSVDSDLRNYASDDYSQQCKLDPALNVGEAYSHTELQYCGGIYRRASCRYTQEGSAAFAGIVAAPFENRAPLFGDQHVVLAGEEAFQLLQLKDRADKLKSEAIGGRINAADFSDIVWSLNSEVVCYAQRLTEGGSIEFLPPANFSRECQLPTCPAVLTLFVWLVELLDLYMSCCLIDASDQKVNSRNEFLKNSVASAEFMSLCKYFAQGSLQIVHALGASDLANELQLHALFSICLQPQQGTSGHVCEIFLLETGHSALSIANISRLSQSIVFDHLVRASLALDALGLGLRCLRSDKKRSKFGFARGRVKMILTPLALLAIEALDKMPVPPRVSTESIESIESVETARCSLASIQEAVVVAAMRLLATIADTPGAIVNIPLRDGLSGALAKHLSARPLTARTADALEKLVRGRKPLSRVRAWFRHGVDIGSEIHKACVMADVPRFDMQASRKCRDEDGLDSLDPALLAKLDSLRDEVRTMSTTFSSSVATTMTSCSATVR